MLSRGQILRNQLKAVALLLILASLLGIAEGVVASPDNQKAFWRIPTNLFAVYNFLVLGIGGVFLARAVLFNLGLVPNFVVKGRGFLSGAKVGLIRTLANAAIFPLLQDTWSQALQVLNSKPPNTPAYVIITGIFPRYDWEGIRYPGIGAIFGRATPPFNFPFWYYIWIAGLISYFAIDVVRLYGMEIENFGEQLFARITPMGFVSVFVNSVMGRAYLHIRWYAKIAFQAVG